MKPNHLKKTIYVTISVIIIVFTFAAKSEFANFTGKWRLNKDKSDMGESRFRSASDQVTVNQTDNKLNIERLYIRQSGEEFKSTEELTLDGKECTNLVFGDRGKKSTATWSVDQKILNISSVMVFEREGEQMTINTTEVWSISEDHKSLTIDYSSMSARGERKFKLIYDRE